MKHYWLYILKLERDKYYIGITTQTPEKRFTEHVNHIRPAYWTMKYKPLKIIDRKDLGMMNKEDAETYESKVVRKYMKEKGYNNARGGDLTDEEDYVFVGGKIFLSWDWYSLKTVAYLLLVIVILTILYYLK